MAYRLNQRLAGFRCLQCGIVHPVADHFGGCPVCLEAGSPSSVAAAYRGFPDSLAAPGGRGCARYADWLACRDWRSLGEGGTPLVEVPGLAEPPGTGRVLVKNEGQNPTGSHKDRMSMLAGADRRDRFPGTSALLSIGGDTVTYQALDALALCGGTAAAVAEPDVSGDQKLLAECGLYLELSSAAALTGLRRLRERGAVAPDETTVLIATSHGFKEEGVFGAGIPVVG